MKRAVLLLLSAWALTALADDDPWAKVRQIESGTDLRIYRVDAKEPLAAKLDHAGEDSLVVTTKSGQMSILRESIDRLDRRAPKGKPLVKETRTERKITPKGAENSANAIPGATTSVTTGLNFPSKPGFETVYRRAPAGK